MAKEKEPTAYDSLREVYGNLVVGQEAISDYRKYSERKGLAGKLLGDEGKKDEAEAILRPTEEDAIGKLNAVAAQRYQKSYEKFVKNPQNFKKVISSAPKDIIDNFLYSMAPDPKKVKGFKELAKLHAEVVGLEKTIQYVAEGDVNKKMEPAAKATAMQILQEYYIDKDENYNTKDPEELKGLKQGIAMLHLNVDGLRESKFLEIAPELLEKKKAEFDAKIEALRDSGTLGDYVAKILPKEVREENFYQYILSEDMKRSQNRA